MVSEIMNSIDLVLAVVGIGTTILIYYLPLSRKLDEILSATCGHLKYRQAVTLINLYLVANRDSHQLAILDFLNGSFNIQDKQQKLNDARQLVDHRVFDLIRKNRQMLLDFDIKGGKSLFDIVSIASPLDGSFLKNEFRDRCISALENAINNDICATELQLKLRSISDWSYDHAMGLITKELKQHYGAEAKA